MGDYNRFKFTIGPCASYLTSNSRFARSWYIVLGFCARLPCALTIFPLQPIPHPSPFSILFMKYLRLVHDGPLGTFPVEIYEQIMDCIPSSGAGEDGICATRSALYSCALTCQAWVPRSRFLLYCSITLYASGASPHYDVRRLADTIISSPLIADLVKDLTISETSASKSGIASILPLMLVDRLPKLHTLTIRETTLVVSAAYCHSIASFSALATLNLATLMFANVSALRRLLAALPKLRDLTLDNVFWQTAGVWREAVGQYTGQMPRIRRLSMMGGQVCTFR